MGMLILTRKSGESIDIVVPPGEIGHHITVTVTRVEDKRVSIGVDAAPQVAISRREVSESFKDFKPRPKRGY